MEWWTAWEINVKSVFLTARAVLTLLLKTERLKNAANANDAQPTLQTYRAS